MFDKKLEKIIFLKNIEHVEKNIEFTLAEQEND